MDRAYFYPVRPLSPYPSISFLIARHPLLAAFKPSIVESNVTTEDCQIIRDARSQDL